MLILNYSFFCCCLIVQVSGSMLSCFLMTMPFAPWVVNSLCTEKWWKNYLRTHCSVFVCTYTCLPVSSMNNLPFLFFLISKIFPLLLPLEQHFGWEGETLFSFLPRYCFNCIPVRYGDNIRAFAVSVFVCFCSEIIFQAETPFEIMLKNN